MGDVLTPKALAVILLGLVAVAAYVGLTPPPPKDRTIKVLALSATGKWVAGGTSQGTIRLWNLADEPPSSRTLEIPGTLNDLRFSDRGEYLAVAHRDITLLQLKADNARRVIRNDQANYGTVRFRSDGHSLLTINGKGEILVVDLKAGTAQPAYCCSSIWGEVDFTPDGNQIVWAGHWPGLWDLRHGALVGRLTETRQVMTYGPIAWDTGGGTVFLGSQDGRVYQWDLATRTLLRTSPAQSGYVRSIAVIRDTGWVAYAAESGPVWLWNPKSGPSRTVPGARTTSNLVFDPSRNLTAFANASGSIEFWNLPEGRMLRTLD